MQKRQHFEWFIAQPCLLAFHAPPFLLQPKCMLASLVQRPKRPSDQLSTRANRDEHAEALRDLPLVDVASAVAALGALQSKSALCRAKPGSA